MTLTRRHFVLGSTAAVAAAGTPLAQSTAAPPPLTADDGSLADLTAVEAAAHMAHGDFTAERYAQALVNRCTLARALNAFIAFEPEHVLADARARDVERARGAPCGPLFGIPIPVKDSVNTQDYATTAGTPALRGFRPAQDAPIVTALRAAGAVVLGKTNLHELSYGWTSNNLAFGAVHNPYDPTRIPGGSSGGTAAAVAARLAPLGVAEDTEGSIRIPAAFCGVAGFRPTTGRYSTRGCVPITPLFDQVGPIARSVGDLALFDTVATGERRPLQQVALHGIRLGIVRDYFFEDLDPEVERLTVAALDKLRAAGIVLVEGALPTLRDLIDHSTLLVQNHDVSQALESYLKEFAAPVTFGQLLARASPDIRDLFRTDVLHGGANVPPDTAYAAARDRYLPALRKLYRNYFASSGVTAIVFPAARVPPTLIGAESALTVRGRQVPFEVAIAQNIAPGSTAGLPGLVLPAGLTTGGLPVGLEFDGPAGTDRALLSTGAALAAVLGGIPPPRYPV